MKFSKDKFLKDRKESYERSQGGELDLLKNGVRKRQERGNKCVR